MGTSLKSYTLARYPASQKARQILGRAYIQTLAEKLRAYALCFFCGVAIGGPALVAVVTR